MADTALSHPVDFLPLNERQKTDLHAALGPMVALANPLDYHTYIWGDLGKMTAAFVALADPSLAMTLLVLDLPRSDNCDPSAWECAIDAVIAAQAQTGLRFGVVTSLPENLPEEVARRFARAGVVPLFDPDHGLAAIATAAACAPAKSAPPVVLGHTPTAPRVVTEPDAKARLRDAGLRVGPCAVVTDATDLAAFTAAHTGPFVLKTIGEAHKSESGGVRLNIIATTATTVANELGYPLFIEKMVTDSLVELLVGVVRDPAHGFVLTVGAGGIQTEILQDTAHMVIPASREEITAALHSLQIAPLLQGYRGWPAVNLTAILDNIEALQAYVTTRADLLEEIEINPLICSRNAAIVADALIRMETNND